MVLEFKNWMREQETNENFLDLISTVGTGIAQSGPAAFKWAKDKWTAFMEWLSRLKQASYGTYKMISAILANHAELKEVIVQLPIAFETVMRDPVLKDTVMNKSFLAAMKQLSENPDLEKEALTEKIKELQTLIKQGGDEAAFAEEFWRSNIGDFVKSLWKITHLGPILKRLPQVTLVNSWKILRSFWDNQQKNVTVKGGTLAACFAALELLHFIGSGALMTGLLGKVLIALHMTTLGFAFAGGAWIAWGLISLFHKDHSSDQEEGAKIIAGIIKAIDPGTNFNLIDRYVKQKSDQPSSSPPLPPAGASS